MSQTSSNEDLRKISPQREISPVVLRRYVALSLLAQVVLSIAVLFVTTLSDRIVSEAYKYADIAATQRYVFQSIGLTTRRLSNEIKAEIPNPRLIARIQYDLQEQTLELEAISNQIEAELSKEGMFNWFRSVDTGSDFKRVTPKFDEFKRALFAMAYTPYENLSHTDVYSTRIYLAISPVSTISKAINSVTDELRVRAESYQQILWFIRIGIVLLMIAIAVALGTLLLFPALKKLTDVMAREYQLRRKMERMALTDPLTSISNREGLNKIVASLKPDQLYAYAIIDLNLFKAVNDTFGHAVGDEVLVELSRRLKRVSGELTHPARIGGDEFAVIDLSANKSSSCKQLGSDLVSIFTQPVLFEGTKYHIGGSVGIALSSDVKGGFDAVAKAADSAMYALKGDSKTGFDVYSVERHGFATDLTRKLELATALESREIKPWYQPKVDMRNGQMIGLEALARWHHPKSGIITPQKFLADIAEYSFHFELTCSMFKQVLQQLSDWQNKSLKMLPVAINVSADILAVDDSVKAIRNILHQYHHVKKYITIEITEDVFLPRIADAVKKSIHTLSKEGIRFSIDDFGSGYASLRHLSEFMFHEVKFDKSFIWEIGKASKTETILLGLCKTFQGLDITLVAEGIEAQEQADFMVQAGCAIGQGYFYSQPLPCDRVEQLLLNQAWVKTG